ncbi:lysophospholipid acyltransferase family protein [Cognatilysobacter lacus]|uniref:Acyltransferase n=1 Tax=Cognatilysobacter lacus TaxID=1643323 RepID=A0A5D8Z4Y7_9GAMM|nr:lysophospholipid acyltransferase family protein [Lysobacter lacus]TZF89737.1 acyltransferase [Lysobacter lacus]
MGDGYPAHEGAPGRVPRMPPRVPQVPPNRLTRGVGRLVLRLGGWRMVGELPDAPKVVLIGAPHSSNWDGIWGFAAKLALGLDIRVLGKDTLFKVPVVGAILRGLGVLPVDRSNPKGVVEQAAAMLRDADALWFGLAPEGTRRRVEKWKSGFWKIARAADAPVLPVYFHYPDRVIGIGPLWRMTEDFGADMRRIRAWYAPWQGKNRGTV